MPARRRLPLFLPPGAKSLGIVFLDIDGVLNDHTLQANGYCGIGAKQVQHLNRILRETGTELVISSAWRYMIRTGVMTLEGFENLLMSHGVDCRDRVRGRTVFDEEIPGRGAQISQWLFAHDWKPGQPYVVIDDLELDIREAGHPLVLTDGLFGLGPEDADEVIQILCGPRQAEVSA